MSNRKISKHILILCEGWTEYKYAQSLKNSLNRDKQRGIVIDISKPNNENKAYQLISKAKERINTSKTNKNPYDVVWLFFDNDLQDLENVFKQIKTFNEKNSTKIEISYSCISIEHWFIIHFKDVRKPFEKAKDAEKELCKLWKKSLREPYDKSLNHYEKLKDKMESAIKIAKQIHKQTKAKNKPIYKCNPYFSIHNLIEFMKQL
jgi:hypothetical protein